MAQIPAPSATTRRRAQRMRAQYLVTADESSLAELEATLAGLPLCATGRVFVEVPDASWIAPIEAPGRMTVTWLDRSRRSGAPGTGRACTAGAALTRAVTAWADEMMCADDDATQVVLLGGFLGTADILDHLTERVGAARETIHTPPRFGIGLVG
ncbi:SIP domain-containing protein [Microbacterium sp. X-17]|uniref:SIP domain-containing protein n=1 Tax=Microbacterium sp. X-17 TaxID=3144404 RepID=UPI0031F4CFF3